MAKAEPTIIVNITPKALKVKGAAEVMQTSEMVVRNLIKAGLIKAMNLPALTISVKEIERVIDYITDSQIDLKDFAAKRFEEIPESKLIEIKEYMDTHKVVRKFNVI